MAPWLLLSAVGQGLSPLRGAPAQSLLRWNSTRVTDKIEEGLHNKRNQLLSFGYGVHKQLFHSSSFCENGTKCKNNLISKGDRHMSQLVRVNWCFCSSPISLDYEVKVFAKMQWLPIKITGLREAAISECKFLHRSMSSLWCMSSSTGDRTPGML